MILVIGMGSIELVLSSLADPEEHFFFAFLPMVLIFEIPT